MSEHVRGQLLLRHWLDGQDKTHEQAAVVLGTTVPTLRSWLAGARRPSLAAATVLEQATGGFVTRDDWLTPIELASVRAAGAGQ